jgi:hypothetical protein
VARIFLIVHIYFYCRFEIKIESTTGLASPDVPPETYKKLKRQLLSFGDWPLHGLYYNSVDFQTENSKQNGLELYRHIFFFFHS